MQTVPHEPIALPPLEAFLIRPQFTSSDLWVWPLFGAFLFLWLRSIHKAAGLQGRDIDLLTGVRVLNGVCLWGTVIGLSNAVHRVTDDVVVSGLWTGVALALSSLAYRGALKFTPLAPVDQRARAAVDARRAVLRAKEAARKLAKARGEVFVDPDAPARERIVYSRDSPAEARHQVSALVRPDLFADPQPGSPAPVRPAPDPD